MEHHLPVLRNQEPGRACVWVEAGLLTFRLCDRGYACESCPLDAAIRGLQRAQPASNDAAHGGDPAATWEFPEDRLYSGRHVWVQPLGTGRVRVGLDACAARLLPPVKALRGALCGERLEIGGAICLVCVEGGEVEVASPVAGQMSRWNAELDTDPAAIAAKPYTAGWIGEIMVDADAGLDRLIHSEAARELARLDARHLGRQAAFGLLAPQSSERCWMDRELLDATRHVLGDEAYLNILRGVLH